MASPCESDVSDLAAAAYDAALDYDLWPSVLQQLRTAFGAMTVHIVGHDLTRMRHFLISAGGDPAASESYVAHYARLDPVAASMACQPVGRVVTEEVAMPKSAFTRTEFYTDWVRPQGMWQGLFATAIRDGPVFAMVALTRGRHQDAFDGENVATLDALMPHLRRAMRTTCRLAAAEARCVGAEDLLGCLREGALLLGAGGAVLYANRSAEALLRMGDGLTTAQGKLGSVRAADDAALRRALAAAVAGEGSTLRIERPSGRPALALTVQPATAGRLAARDRWHVARTPFVLIFVVDPTCTGTVTLGNILQTHYGLTPAEAAVADAVAQGLGVKNAAEMLGVARTTVRWHLQRVFEKTGTARQAELARLVERLGVLGNHNRV